MNTKKKFFSNKRLLRISTLLTLIGILMIVGVVYADVPTRVGVRGTVPDPGTQQQELPNITIPAPYNVFEFVVTCMACHGGTIDQNTGHGGNWAGSSMASAARDPIFRANQIIFNNAILAATGKNGAGNECVRCHSPNAWLSGRFDPTLGGEAEGRTMMHSILLSTDDEGVLCEFCHRSLGNVTFKRADLNPNDPVWNMMAGIGGNPPDDAGWPHDGGPYVDQDGSPTIADGNPYGDGTVQLHDGMTYNARYPGIVDVYFDDIPLVSNGAGGYVRDTLGLTPYTGQTYGIYPPGWIDPIGNPVGGEPVVSPDGSVPITFDAPIGPPLNPDGTPCYNCQSISLEHPTTDNGFVTGPMTSQDSRLCGSCHDETMAVQNNGMPVQRTYSEWKFSAYGRQGADFRNCQSCHMPRLQHEYSDEAPATLNVDPVLSGWFPYAKSRVNTAFHKLVGANRDLPMMMKELYPEVDLEVVGAPTDNDTRIFPGMNSDRATMWNRTQRNTEVSLLDGVDVEIVSGPTWNGATSKWEMQVKVINQSGHRIPSGYSNGRRFWINVEVTDQTTGTMVYQSGSYDQATATLWTAPGVAFNRALGRTISDASNAVMVYERVTGTCVDDGAGNLISCTPSPNPLNDTILFDNRIPPKGFDYAAYQNAGAKFWNYNPTNKVPFEEAARYPGGQNWDLVTYTFSASPTAQLRARVELYWQTQSREFVEYLKNADTSTVRPEGPPSIYDPNYPLNPTYLSDVIGLTGMTDLDGAQLRDNWGGIAYAAWLLTGKGAPYQVAADDTTAAAPPAAPANLTGLALDPFTNQVNWDAVSGADGYLVWVQYGLNLTTSWDKLGIVYDDGDLTTPLLIQHEGLNVAKSYQYKVQAFNGAGFSADSATFIVQTPIDLPLPPENLLMVSSTGTEITMSWLDGADNETHFVIQRQSVPPVSPFVTVATIPSQTPLGGTGGNNWMDTGLQPGTCYNYQVAASNASGMSTWNVNGPVQMCTAGVPTGPITLNAIAANAYQVDLTWSSANGTVLGYRIERSTDNGLTWPTTFNITNPAQLGYSDTSAQPNTTYWYRVFAYNAVGDSPPSNTATVITPDTPPAAPSDLVATPSLVGPLPPTVTLAWIDHANNETGFYIERAPDNNGAGVYVQIAAVTVANTTSYVDATVQPKMTYWYRVRAYNGVGPSLYSNEARVVTPGQIPETPSNLRVTATTKTSISIAWNDNSTNEAGFYVERSLNGVTWTREATVAFNVTNFTNTGLKNNTLYYYRVQAFNADGVTAYTAPVSAKTKK